MAGVKYSVVPNRLFDLWVALCFSRFTVIKGSQRFTFCFWVLWATENALDQVAPLKKGHHYLIYFFILFSFGGVPQQKKNHPCETSIPVARLIRHLSPRRSWRRICWWPWSPGSSALDLSGSSGFLGIGPPKSLCPYWFPFW